MSLLQLPLSGCCCWAVASCGGVAVIRDLMRRNKNLLIGLALLGVALGMYMGRI